MAGRVLCIELGSALTKVCEMDYGKTNPSVYDSFMFETPDGTIEEGYIKSTEVFRDVFKKELSDRNITTNKIIFAVYSNKIATREATIPLVKNDMILSVIQSNASDYFPIDLAGYQLGYTVLDRINTKDEKTLKLSIVAAPKDMLETYLVLSKALDMQLVDIDFAGNSIFQAVKDTSNTVQVSIHMNEFSTLISVIDNGKMMMQRSIAYGVFGAIDAVKGLPEYNMKPDFTTMDAIDVLTNQSYIDPEFSQGDTYSAGMGNESAASGASRIVTDSLRYLVGNVARVIDYYISKNQGTVIGELKLTGLGSQFKGINELFANEIGIKTRQIIAIPSVSFERSGMGSMLSVMLLAIGSNLAPMGLVPDEVAKQKAETKRQGSFVLGLIIMLLCFAGIGGLLVIGNIKLLAANLKTEQMQKEITEKEYIEAKKLQYEEINAIHTDFLVVYNTTSNNNENLDAFINEMEEKMPASIRTTQVNATADGIILEIEVETKEEAADVVQQLRNFESIEVLSSNAADLSAGNVLDSDDEEEEQEDVLTYEREENLVKFTVTCVYRPYGETDEEVAE